MNKKTVPDSEENLPSENAFTIDASRTRITMPSVTVLLNRKKMFATQSSPPAQPPPFSPPPIAAAPPPMSPPPISESLSPPTPPSNSIPSIALTSEPTPEKLELESSVSKEASPPPVPTSISIASMTNEAIAASPAATLSIRKSSLNKKTPPDLIGWKLNTFQSSTSSLEQGILTLFQNQAISALYLTTTPSGLQSHAHVHGESFLPIWRGLQWSLPPSIAGILSTDGILEIPPNPSQEMRHVRILLGLYSIHYLLLIQVNLTQPQPLTGCLAILSSSSLKEITMPLLDQFRISSLKIESVEKK